MTPIGDGWDQYLLDRQNRELTLARLDRAVPRTQNAMAVAVLWMIPTLVSAVWAVADDSMPYWLAWLLAAMQLLLAGRAFLWGRRVRRLRLRLAALQTALQASPFNPHL